MKYRGRRVWVVETRWNDHDPWEPAETVHNDPAIYFTRTEARRDIRELQIAFGAPDMIRVVSYVPGTPEEGKGK